MQSNGNVMGWVKGVALVASCLTGIGAGGTYIMSAASKKDKAERPAAESQPVQQLQPQALAQPQMPAQQAALPQQQAVVYQPQMQPQLQVPLQPATLAPVGTGYNMQAATQLSGTVNFIVASVSRSRQTGAAYLNSQANFRMPGNQSIKLIGQAAQLPAEGYVGRQVSATGPMIGRAGGSQEVTVSDPRQLLMR